MIFNINILYINYNINTHNNTRNLQVVSNVNSL